MLSSVEYYCMYYYEDQSATLIITCADFFVEGNHNHIHRVEQLKICSKAVAHP